ncbi:MAG: CvpA family protein [Bacteroidetes bacterium]|nr:CvpA family protein [Bacteroidota bacterium]MBP6413250.1 CvpA family protein [Bacteroidia bacterium]
MNFLDVILLLPLLFAAWWGFTKGLIIEIASVLALVLGIYGAVLFADKTAAYLTDSLDFHSSNLHLIAFLITFIGLVVGVYFMAKVMEGIVAITGLSVANRIAGAVFGILKMGIILSGLIYILNQHNLVQKWVPENFRKEAILYTPVSKIALKIIPKLELLFS